MSRRGSVRAADPRGNPVQVVQAAAGTAAAAPPRWPLFVSIVWIFLIFAPPLGTFLVGLPALMWWFDSALLPALAIALVLAVDAAYLVFGLPALLTGIVAARWWSRPRGWRLHLRLGAIAALLSAPCAGVAFLRIADQPFLNHHVVAGLALSTLAGAVGSALVSVLLQWLRALYRRFAQWTLARSSAGVRQPARTPQK